LFENQHPIPHFFPTSPLPSQNVPASRARDSLSRGRRKRREKWEYPRYYPLPFPNYSARERLKGKGRVVRVPARSIGDESIRKNYASGIGSVEDGKRVRWEGWKRGHYEGR
jgi:hypothetical protein